MQYEWASFGEENFACLTKLFFNSQKRNSSVAVSSTDYWPGIGTA
jgi:hypothetical protein